MHSLLVAGWGAGGLLPLKNCGTYKLGYPRGGKTDILGTQKGDPNSADVKIWLPVVSRDSPLYAYSSPSFLKELGQSLLPNKPG
jgi:hypothetical protein